MVALKRCPFCGGQAYIECWEMAPFEKQYIQEENDGFYYGITCMNCEASTGGKLSEEKVIEAWNRRVGEDG